MFPFDSYIGGVRPKAKGHVAFDRDYFTINLIERNHRHGSGNCAHLEMKVPLPDIEGLWLMEILLHLGAHRCASTTFQSYLTTHRVRLAGQGLTSWTPKRTRDGMMRGLVRRPTLITVEDERHAIRSLGRMRVEMDRLDRAGQRTLVISEENLMGSVRYNVSDASLYPLLAERLMRFRPAFDGRLLKVGLCIRRYDDFWASGLSYFFGRGGAAPDVDKLDFLTTQPRRWRSVIRDIAKALPDAEIVVWPFEAMANRPAAQLASFSSEAFDLPATGMLWRNRGADLVHLNEMAALCGRKPITEGPVEVGTRWMPFDDEQRAVLQAEYQRDLAWFKAGAEGLARYVDGPEGALQNADIKTNSGDGRLTPAPRPDRADVTHTAQINAVLFGGRYDGIEKGRRDVAPINQSQ